MNQGSLDFGASRRARASIRDRWAAFHRDNPQVGRLFERFALEALRSSSMGVGAKAIWERMRWHARFETRGETWKLNNNYTAYYARWFLGRHPEYAERLETRKVRS